MNNFDFYIEQIVWALAYAGALANGNNHTTEWTAAQVADQAVKDFKAKYP